MIGLVPSAIMIRIIEKVADGIAPIFVVVYSRRDIHNVLIDMSIVIDTRLVACKHKILSLILYQVQLIECLWKHIHVRNTRVYEHPRGIISSIVKILIESIPIPQQKTSIFILRIFILNISDSYPCICKERYIQCLMDTKEKRFVPVCGVGFI